MKSLVFFSIFFITSYICLAQSNSWQRTDFPQQYGGNIQSVYISTNGTLFSGANQDGLMRSTNNGENWEQVHQGSQYGDNILVATTSTDIVFAFVNYDLVRSTDNGTNWTSIGLPQADFVSGIVIDSNDHIYVSVFSSGVFCSTDLGNSWSAINNGFINFYPRNLLISPIGSPQALYSYGDSAGTGIGWSFYRSTNSGSSWTLLSMPRVLGDIFIHSNGDLYLPSGSGLYRSTDMGNSWQLVNMNIYYQYYEPMLSLPNGDILGGQNQKDGIIFRSSDNGYNWSVFDTLNCFEIMNMLYGEDGFIYIGTYRSGLFKTTDQGLTWLQCNTGFPNSTSQVTSITEKPGGIMLAGTTQFGTFISTNSGQSWSRNYPGYYSDYGNNYGATRLVAHPNGPIFAASVGSNIPYLKISNDNGNHWNLLPSYGGGYTYDLTKGASETIYVFGAGGIKRSTDVGISWITIPSPGAGPLLHITQQGSIIVLSTYTDSRYGITTYYTNVSTDGGTSWTTSSPSNNRVAIYDYASTSNEYLFAATGLGVYRSVDTGKTWISMNTGLPSNNIRSLAVNSIDVLFAGTNGYGVFYSKNYGMNWNPVNNGLTDTVITTLFCDSDGYLFAGTFTKGIFKTIDRTTSVDNQMDQYPVDFALNQNYPNPFNPNTTICYSLPTKSFVTLKIYNLLGEEIITIYSGYRERGTFTETWNAMSQSTGIYFYRLTAGNYTETKKMLLIK